MHAPGEIAARPKNFGAYLFCQRTFLACSWVKVCFTRRLSTPPSVLVQGLSLREAYAPGGNCSEGARPRSGCALRALTEGAPRPKMRWTKYVCWEARTKLRVSEEVRTVVASTPVGAAHLLEPRIFPPRTFLIFGPYNLFGRCKIFTSTPLPSAHLFRAPTPGARPAGAAARHSQPARAKVDFLRKHFFQQKSGRTSSEALMRLDPIFLS